MKKLEAWAIWERDVNEALGLRATIASGSKFYDVGDGVSPEGDVIPLIADAKCTEKKSYSINSDLLDTWLQKAAEMGKMFILPVRFENSKDKDWVVLNFEDFLTILLLARKALQDGV